MTEKIISFLKREVVLLSAMLLAVLSMLFVKPDKEYIGYIDYKTIALLFCLMTVTSVFQKIGIFNKIAESILKKARGMRAVVAVLIFLCFFSSMLITNDVALITFVPFAITVLKCAGEEQRAIPVIVMQTIAANLGSMLTPIGNPQNLYLYAQAGMCLTEFVMLMLPYSLVAFLVLCLFVVSVKNNRVDSASLLRGKAVQVPPRLVREVIKNVDYSLLFTFVCFFVFVGNMERIPEVSRILARVIEGREIITSVLASQIISNVPAALLLSGFTDKWELLIIGTNLGGLGTLIASMASLISYKYAVREYPGQKGKYFVCFTLFNVIFLVIYSILF